MSERSEPNSGASKTDIEPMTKGLYRNGMNVKEYLDQKEEITKESVPFEYSELTKKVFEMVYLAFYYWCIAHKDGVEWFCRVVEEENYVKVV